ncbi:N-acetylmuramoyl-L-alanine amidase [Amycolatopsis sp. NPDC059021]|uniref:N-acetylmuramoyl-L-alanine amidase n=1 Tax=Amycolatopsis sp. NPDC059021 TaxID=3346704 RepID=UPI0036733542
MVAVRHRVTSPLLVSCLLLGACGTGDVAAPPAPKTSPSTPATTTTSAPPERVVVLDPGHNGGSAAHLAEINRLVPAGRGRTKPCNTTGTSTNAGYPEHAFTWDVAQRVGTALGAKGIKVVYTRQDDSGAGPCVDQRAATGNDANADAVVSIHADGSNSAGAHGFHVAYSSPPLNDAQGEPAAKLARTVRNTLRDKGFSTANYLGAEGLAPRDDLAGLNLSTRPAVLVECGNMRDANEAAAMTSATGRQRYATAIAAAIEAYLG